MANALLDGNIHNDTSASTVDRGALIVGNNTPKWDRLPIAGSTNKFLRSDGTDPAWQLIGVSDLPSHNHAATDINSGSLVHERGGLETDVSAFGGLVKISGGATSQVTDNSTNWNTAYNHSQLTSGNPHSVTKSDVSLGNVTNDVQVKKIASSTDTALMKWSGIDGNTPANTSILVDASNNVSGMGTLGCGAIISTGAVIAQSTLYALEGGISRNVLRIADLLIQDGTVASTVKVTMRNIWNGDTVAVTDNVAKTGLPTGNFTLSVGGETLKILDSAISGTVLGAMSGYLYNISNLTTINNCRAVVSGRDIAISFGAGTGDVDITGITTNYIIPIFIYTTSA